MLVGFISKNFIKCPLIFNLTHFFHSASEIKEDAIWLKNNVTPETEIYVKWGTTCAMRRNSIKDQSIQDILLDWPLYTSSFGHVLVSLLLKLLKIKLFNKNWYFNTYRLKLILNQSILERKIN